MNAKGVAECPNTARTLQMGLAPDDYAKVENCAREAKTCGAMFGCMIDSLDGAAGDDAVRQLTGSLPQDNTPARATAPECARLPAICSAHDAEDTGEDCQRMVDNLRQDPAHRVELQHCIDAANNCFAARGCIDKLWFELH